VQYHVPIDLDMWLKSYQDNPAPDELYTVQINTVKELLERCRRICNDGDMD